MSNVDKMRPTTRHQCLFRFVKSGVCCEKGIEFYERLVSKMRKDTVLELEPCDEGEVRT